MALVQQAENDCANFGPYLLFALNLPKIILYFKLKLIKKFDWLIFGQSAAISLTKNSLHMGPQSHEGTIFPLNIIPLNSDLGQENDIKVKIGPIRASWQTPTFVDNSLQWGAPNV